MRDDEKIFREAADIYGELYGKKLLEEADELNKPDIYPAELSLERRIRKQIADRKRKAYLRVIAAAAACIVLFVFVPNTLKRSAESSQSEPTSSWSDASYFEVIPLSATLPYGFTQAGFEQDHEKSVYYIEDIYSDDVVLVLEKSEEKLDDGGLTYIPLDAADAYGTSTDGYSLLTFAHDGVLYTMTCRHDINTLVRLGKGIV